jgi:hypothetical protein
MQNVVYLGHRNCPLRRKILARLLMVALVPGLPVSVSYAAEISLGNTDVTLRWDNTVKYSAAFRAKDRSPALVADPNQDDGDRNFKKGLISNRVDLLSEFDLTYKENAGLRVSAAGWYDGQYRKSNDNDSAATANNFSVASNEFNQRTRELHGGKAEVLDAFVFAKGNLGEIPSNIRVGKHTILYGESLFFGSNGIANGQAPLDIIKLLSVPNSQFKEIVRPVNQVSGQLQLSENLALGAYYQFAWNKTLIPSVGSYFSNADVLEGSERFLLPPSVVPVPGAALYRAADLRPRDSGQGGMQLRWRPKGSDLEFGLYAIQYHDKTPQVYLYPGVSVDPGILKFGEYRLVYPNQNIRSYGISVSTQLGDVNVSGEASVRRDTPLVSEPQFVAPTADNEANAAYALGNSAHAQVSAIYIVPPGQMWNSAVFVGELAWNRRTSVTSNANALAANSSRDAWAMRFIFTPTWYQVSGLLDLSVPVGLGYSSKGNSSVVSQFNPGGKKGGDISVGLQGIYQQTWKFGINYAHFFGSEGTALNQLGQFSFKQTFADRDFVSLSVQRTF